MKQRKIMFCKVNKIILCVVLLSTISCKSQNLQDSLDCKNRFDINGKLYEIVCFKANLLVSDSYVDTNSNKIEICRFPDKEAIVFSGNDSLYNHFVTSNLKWPKCGGEGRVSAALLIDETGNIVDKRIIRGIPGGCNEFNESAFNLINKLPKWNPAVKNGINVKSIKIIFIYFN